MFNQEQKMREKVELQLTIFIGCVNLATQNSASGRHRISQTEAPLATAPPDGAESDGSRLASHCA